MSDKSSPHMAVETFLSLCKYFLIIIVAINLIWAAVFLRYIDKSFSDTTMSAEMSLESGTQNNNQSITNGKSND